MSRTTVIQCIAVWLGALSLCLGFSACTKRPGATTRPVVQPEGIPGYIRKPSETVSFTKTKIPESQSFEVKVTALPDSVVTFRENLSDYTVTTAAIPVNEIFRIQDAKDSAAQLLLPPLPGYKVSLADESSEATLLQQFDVNSDRSISIDLTLGSEQKILLIALTLKKDASTIYIPNESEKGSPTLYLLLDEEGKIISLESNDKEEENNKKKSEKNLRLTSIQQDYEFCAQPNKRFFFNLLGKNEKWIRSEKNPAQPWYYITEDGTLYLSNGERVLDVGTEVHQNPYLLTEIPLEEETDPLVIDRKYKLYIENLATNWGGINERWIRAEEKSQFLLLTKEGVELRKYQSPTNPPCGALITIFEDSEIYSKPEKLTENPLETEPDLKVWIYNYLIQKTATTNYYGKNEKWVKNDDSSLFHFLLPDNSLRVWYDRPDAVGDLVSVIDPAYYADRNLLIQAWNDVQNGYLRALMAVEITSNFEFGDVKVGEQAEKTITIQNYGGQTSAFSTSSLEGEFQFKGNSFPGDGGTCSQNQTLAHNEKCTMVIVFQPTTEGGKRSQLSLPYAENAKSLVIELNGKGIPSS